MKTDRDDLVAAIIEFETALPDWWWSIGYCGISRDADCKPAPRAMGGPDYSAALEDVEVRLFSDGFRHDDVDRSSTVAGSLRNVMRQALAAKAALWGDPEAARSRYIAALNRGGYSEETAHALAAEVDWLKAKGK